MKCRLVIVYKYNSQFSQFFTSETFIYTSLVIIVVCLSVCLFVSLLTTLRKNV